MMYLLTLLKARKEANNTKASFGGSYYPKNSLEYTFAGSKVGPQ